MIINSDYTVKDRFTIEDNGVITYTGKEPFEMVIDGKLKLVKPNEIIEGTLNGCLISL